MLRPIYVALFLLVSSTIIAAQSGRRITTLPTPVPKPAEEIGPQFSESKPRPARIPRPAVQKKEKKSDNQAQVANSNAVPPPVDDDGETLRIETSLITIPVSVFDRNGLYIPGLRQPNFKIYEDGVEQEIAYFGTTDQPFTVALVIDVSPSTAYKIEEIQYAARAFVEQLGPRDSVIVIAFDENVDVLAKVTTDREKIYKAIRKAGFGNGTSLYNAVDEALRKQLGKISGRKAVVLFTDGVDTTSTGKSYDSTLNYAEESDSMIFPIYYNTFLDNQRRTRSVWPDIFGGMSGGGGGASAEDYALGRRYLNDLADATGGRVFRPESTPGGLTAAFEGIAEELRRQYNIGYVPKDEGKPGQRKQIKVRVDRPNLVIRSRDSYIVGAAVSTPVESPKKQGT
jgi:Ca-activated chloride channel homolog